MRKRQRNPKPECSGCGGQLEDKRKGKYRYCLACHRAYMKRTRPKHSELPEEARKRANARAYLKEYVKRGKIQKGPCVICGDPGTEAHHEDYNKPLEVQWYCRVCHVNRHTMINRIKNNVFALGGTEALFNGLLSRD